MRFRCVISDESYIAETVLMPARLYQLPYLCSMEINEIRPFFVRAMGVMVQLAVERAPGAGEVDFGDV